MSVSWAIITPSYFRDYERCRLLCRSIDRFVTGAWHHYIIVDPPDLHLFKPFAGPNRTVICKDDILPQGLRYRGAVPFMRLGRFWASWKHGVVFGWQMQQYIKLMAAKHIHQDAMLFCDSDLCFMKPCDVSGFTRGEKIRFMSTPASDALKHKFISASADLLDLNKSDVNLIYAGDALITWHRKSAVEMLDYLSNKGGKPWHETIGMRLMFSEYCLYGFFVEYLQSEKQFQYIDNRVYCHTMWGKAEAERISITDFCKAMEPHQVAICYQSLIGGELAPLEAEFEKASASN